VAAVTERRGEGATGAAPGALRVSIVPGAGVELTSVLVEPGLDGASPSIDGQPSDVSVVSLDGRRAVLVAQDPEQKDAGDPDDRRSHRLLLGEYVVGRHRTARVRREVVVDGWRVEVEIEPERWAALRDRAAGGSREHGGHGPRELRAMIPGVVVSVAVTAGDDVTIGQQLLVVEAMKMQNELRAPRDGRIERVAVGAGRRVELGELLVVLE
jgi:biotin carboxyl carrier protein